MKKLNILSLAFLSLLFIPLVAGASLNTNLSYGLQNNSDVKELQEYLISKDFLTGSATGNFYSLTLNAVKKYQKSVGVTQSGYVGILTRTAINKELASNLSASNQEATEPKTTNDVGSTVQSQIALLQKQLEALKAQQTTTPTPTNTPPVWDACKNIEGIQSLAPTGMYADNGSCFSLNTSTTTPIPTPTPNPTPTPIPTPTSQPTLTEVSFDSLDNFIFVNRTETHNSITPYANNIHEGDMVSFTINGQAFTKTFGKYSGVTKFVNGYYQDSNGQWKPYNQDETFQGSYSFPILENLQPNTEYPYSLKVQRSNQYAIKNGSFKTLVSPN